MANRIQRLKEIVKSPGRLFHAHHMAEGAKGVMALQQEVLKAAPMSAGPLAALAPQPAAAGAEAPELREAHCHSCKEKKSFQVEGEDTMPNGAIRKYGKGVCGHKLSTFVSGKESSGTA
jgi:hypothetical protein